MTIPHMTMRAVGATPSSRRFVIDVAHQQRDAMRALSRDWTKARWCLRELRLIVGDLLGEGVLTQPLVERRN